MNPVVAQRCSYCETTRILLWRKLSHMCAFVLVSGLSVPHGRKWPLTWGFIEGGGWTPISGSVRKYIRGLSTIWDGELLPGMCCDTATLKRKGM